MVTHVKLLNSSLWKIEFPELISRYGPSKLFILDTLPLNSWPLCLVRETVRKIVLQKENKSGRCINRFHRFNKTIWRQHTTGFALVISDYLLYKLWRATITVVILKFSTQFRQNCILFIFEVFYVVVRISKIFLQAFFLDYKTTFSIYFFYFYTLKYI